MKYHIRHPTKTDKTRCGSIISGFWVPSHMTKSPDEKSYDRFTTCKNCIDLINYDRSKAAT